ncbi:aldo/keto reductase [Candidatus Enterococcus mansonii]|uniref:Aldo/keto reductase n=1 Tax=Candidatus Enterococcus mansonii TaxID=1834181 RepID=A0A242CKE4_9ENTE|nr:aldo/keto reductase [Enterococcus sp. 4G2_DIV0659]OTO10390.1 aldo/keto reductase [Enterococcus sp. 4G2_DIV0659]
MSVEKTKKLSNGSIIPRLGLGVWKAQDGEEAMNSVKWALEAGYRLIDTAEVYKNEVSVGEGIRMSGVPREEIFITTKLWNTDQGYESTLKAFDESLNKLGLDYVDLYLIHWPVKGKYKDSWRAMEEIYQSGRAKAIGVSNFHQHHLEDLLKDAQVVPVLDQIELHPRLTQEPLRAFLAENNIAVEAWSPLGQGNILEEPILVEIGKKYNKTPAQVIIRWHLQNDIIVIPKSVHQERIKQNIDVFDFELTDEDMEQINQLNKNERFGSNPEKFDF